MRLHGAAEDSRDGAPVTLCIVADDFGLNPGVNRAVLDLVARGRVQAVGCMVGAPAWPAGSARLRRLPRAAVDVGLHLDFSAFPVHAGSRRPLRSLIAAAYTRRLDRAAVRREIAAQLDRFERAMGRAPDFVDGHQHVHQLPVLRDELLALLAARYGASGPWLRSTRRPPPTRGPGVPGEHRPAGFKAWLIERLGGRALSRLALAQGLSTNRALLGVYGFEGGEDAYRARLQAWLAVARDGDLLMCHPADDLAAPGDPIAAARLAEYRVLADPGLASILPGRGIRLAPLGRRFAKAATPASPAGAANTQAKDTTTRC